MAEEKHNLKNPAVKRILQEMKEMQDNPSDDFMAFPLEDNIFEWQFAVRGPSDTEFEGGIYHGRIQLPAEYPFKPPSFMLLTVMTVLSQYVLNDDSWGVFVFCDEEQYAADLLPVKPSTNMVLGISEACAGPLKCDFKFSNSLPLSSTEPNGRFETQIKICLSISNYHPEHWQPSWSVRTALVALIAFMPTDPAGALGSLEYTKEERRALAIKSRVETPRYGSPERQILIDEIHQYVLSKAPPVPQLVSQQAHEERSTNSENEDAQINNQHADIIAEGEANAADPNGMIVQDVREVNWNANAGPLRVSFSAGLRVTRRVDPTEQLQRPEARTRRFFDDRLFTWAAVGLTIAIAVLLLKKFLKVSGYGVSGMDKL